MKDTDPQEDLKNRDEVQAKASGKHWPKPPKEVLPGPIDPGKVPPPIEAVCVQVEKIYDACSQKRCAEVELDALCNVPSRVISCTTSDFDFTCNLTQIQDDPPLVRVNVSYSYTITVIYNDESGAERTITRDVEHEKSVILFGTDEMFCKVEAVLECLGCDILSPNKIFCEVGEYIVIKSALEVQLLIPSYGFCPPPPECEELPTRCEAFLEAPPPPLFPPQAWELDDDNG